MKIPISSFLKPIPLYKLYSLPVPLNTTSHHATQLLDVPEYFVHTSDNQHFALLSHRELQKCTGNDVIFCPFHLALSSVATSSCISAIFYNQKELVHKLCDFRFLPNTLKPSISELAPSTVLMYQISMFALDCPQGQMIMKGCSFCVVTAPCRCTITSDHLYLPPRLGKCKNDSTDISVIHPINLALLQEFFHSSAHSSIFGDTTYLEFVNVKIPDLKIYNHSFSKFLAKDQKYDLSLRKIVSKAKKGETVFKSLAESMLAGEIPYTAGEWPDTSGIIAIIAAVTSGIAIALVICLFAKFRKITTTLLLAQKAAAFTISPSVPSFHYQDVLEATRSPSLPEHVYNSLTTPWPYITLSLLTTSTILIVIYIMWRKFHTDHKTSIFLELTTGTSCQVTRVVSLPLCPHDWIITPPMDISNLLVHGTIFPILTVDWSEFTILNKHTKQHIVPPTKIRISFFKVRALRSILRQPYMAYVLLSHHCYFQILS